MLVQLYLWIFHFFHFFKMALRVNVKWNVEALGGKPYYHFLGLSRSEKRKWFFFISAKTNCGGHNLWKNPFINFLVEFNLFYTKWMEEEDFRSFLAYFIVGKYLAFFYTDKNNCFVVFIFMTETKEIKIHKSIFRVKSQHRI